MTTEHHSLFNEFPELRERIHELKTHDEHFRSLFEEYHELDRMVYRMDENIEPASDDAMEEAKARRVALKDELYGMLKAAG
ncbi:MAG: YdcH family protein [Pseudomonadales bacterium]|jgi:uncharacterized protein YdcH (DUF465 family)|nr:YdcH family protein [Pseudomonadales bacterium]